jgi:SAM-dependent methyltransferase
MFDNKAKVTEAENRRYYLNVEDYDWVKATDEILGLESFFHRARRKIILTTISKYGQKGKFFDAGCGTGLILRELPKGSHGVDINPRNIKKAKLHAPYARIVKSDLEKLPHKSIYFSNIVCTDVLEHFIYPEKPLKELYRVLKKGGVLIGTVPGRSPIWKLRFLSSTRPREPYHRYYKRRELAELLKDSGFKLEYLSYRILAMEILFVAEKE